MYTVKKEASSRAVVLDDMILTKDMPTTAGSKMLDGYMSLFDAEAVTRLTAAGYDICGKAKVGELAIDLLGESSYQGACTEDGRIFNAAAKIVKSGDAVAAVCLDANGSVRRAAAQSGLISIKPTYGTVSRFGVIPVACSGDTVSVMADSVDGCRDVLDVIAGHDCKDGTSLSEEQCAQLKSRAEVKIEKVCVLTSMLDGIDSDVKAKIDAAVDTMKANGITVCEEKSDIIASARVAWNILMSAELCNNVSRYDGVKYGYRSESFTNIDELYTNSRTEAFGQLLKTVILFGSETLSTENYMKVYDKALRTRRVIVEELARLFGEYDAVIMPAASSMSYTEEQVKADKYICYKENFYTAPASVTGLPCVVAGGVQLVGKAFSENVLFTLAKLI